MRKNGVGLYYSLCHTGMINKHPRAARLWAIVVKRKAINFFMRVLVNTGLE